MFILVSPPEFSEELQLICGLDEARRRRFIAVVVADWLDRDAPTDPGTAVSAEMSELLRDSEQLFRPENFAEWAEEADDVYLDCLDADESPKLVRPLFYRARCRWRVRPLLTIQSWMSSCTNTRLAGKTSIPIPFIWLRIVHVARQRCDGFSLFVCPTRQRSPLVLV